MQENKQLSKEERKIIRKEKEEEAKKLRLSIEEKFDQAKTLRESRMITTFCINLIIPIIMLAMAALLHPFF